VSPDRDDEREPHEPTPPDTLHPEDSTESADTDAAWHERLDRLLMKAQQLSQEIETPLSTIREEPASAEPAPDEETASQPEPWLFELGTTQENYQAEEVERAAGADVFQNQNEAFDETPRSDWEMGTPHYEELDSALSSLQPQTMEGSDTGDVALETGAWANPEMNADDTVWSIPEEEMPHPPALEQPGPDIYQDFIENMSQRGNYD
jgi:hypothetical protein